MNRSTIGLLFASFFVIVACETPQFGGPVYDEAGNLAIDRVKIEEYLERADYDSLYRIHDPSGVVVIIQEEGDASRPQPNDVVHANYTGILLDGTVFDTNIEAVAVEHDIYDEDRNYQISSFPLAAPNQGGPITGFTLGFLRMRSGSKGVIIIPSPYGYRNQESEEIPANSVLVFEVDFLGMD